MCGICGIVSPNEAPDRIAANVRRMNALLVSRGPDDEGYWCDGHVALGHRRLAIIDPAGGVQPVVVYREGEHVLIFNGEIYNYQALRQRMEYEGIELKTNSDSEVLLRWMMFRGVQNGLKDVIGMFAFAYWEAKEQRLFLARDRVGIKPLYYSQGVGGRLSFSSELGSLLEDKEIDRQAAPVGLSFFLTLGYCPAPLTCFEGVYELSPGSICIWQKGEICLERYWQIDWERNFSGTVEDAAEELETLFGQVISDHMVSDVPVSAFLSGGIDSSSVVSYMALQHGVDFDAFTIRFNDALYDETSYARMVAEKYGIRHHVTPMESMPLEEDTCRFILRRIGQPFADSSCLPTFLVSKKASEFGKVVLAGDGGDELFAGYDTFDWGMKIRAIQKCPAWVLQGAMRLMRSKWSSWLKADFRRQLEKAFRYSLSSEEQVILYLSAIIDPEDLSILCAGCQGQEPRLDLLRTFLMEGRKLDFISALSRFQFGYSLPGDMLRKVDRMSMSASIEVRVPFLDHRLVEFAMSLPVSFKVREGKRKYLLRRVMTKRLPEKVLAHRKWGFSIPLHNAFSPDFLRFCRKKLLDDTSQVSRLFGKEKVEEILWWNVKRRNPMSHRFSTYTVNHLLWMLLQLELWSEDFGVDLPEAI
jgi:asparagine synthase (glutamine-hydrolysing)